MKKAIKSIAVVLCLSLVLTAFVGCSKENDGASGDKNQPEVKPALFGDWVEITVGDQTFSLPAVEVVINGNTVKMPCTLQSFLKQGELTLPEYAEIPETLTTNESTVITFLNNSNQLTNRVGIVNPASTPLSADNCIVQFFYCHSGSEWEIPAGFKLTLDATLEDVEAAFGAPNSSSDDADSGEHKRIYKLINETENSIYGGIGAEFDFNYIDEYGILETRFYYNVPVYLEEENN